MIPPSGNLQCSEPKPRSQATANLRSKSLRSPLEALITLPMAALITFWHGATSYALPSSPATTRHRGPLTAGAVLVSSLHPDRLHAGERHSLPAENLSGGNPGIHARASLAPRHGKPQPLRKLPVWQRSRRRTGFPIHRISAPRSHRIPSDGCVRTASTGLKASTNSPAPRPSFSRLN